MAIRTSTTKLSFAPQAVKGVIDSVAFQEIHSVSNSMDASATFTADDEINPLAITNGSTLNQVSVAGDAVCNFRNEYNTFVENSLRSTFAAPVAVSLTDITIDNTAKTIITAAGDFVAAGVVVGQYVQVVSTVNPTGFVKVVSVTISTITYTGTLIDETAGSAIGVNGEMVRNGIGVNYMTLEQERDTANYVQFIDSVIDSWAMGIALGSNITSTWGFVSGSRAWTTTSASTGPTVAPPANSRKFNTVSNVTAFMYGSVDVLSTLCPENVNFNVANNMEQLYCLGSVDASDIGISQMLVTGDFSVMYLDDVYYTKLFAETEDSLMIQVENANAVYIFSMPLTKLTANASPIASNDAWLRQAVTFESNDDGNGVVIQVDSFAKL